MMNQCKGLPVGHALKWSQGNKETMVSHCFLAIVEMVRSLRFRTIVEMVTRKRWFPFVSMTLYREAIWSLERTKL